jgi:Uma2 family endonuclease
MTAEEYLAWERTSATKHEYFSGEIIDFAGTSLDHAAIVRNLIVALTLQLRQGPCRTFSTDVRLRIGHGTAYVYPDVMIICGEPAVADDQQDTALNPAVIIEVLSPSTEMVDRAKKFAHYTALPTLQEYVLVTQDTAQIEQYVRQADGKWLYSKTRGLDAVVTLASVNADLRLADVYENVELGNDADAPIDGIVT